MKNMGNYFLIVIIIIAFFITQNIAFAATEDIIGELNNYNTILAVESGTIAENEVRAVLPDAKYIYVNSPSDGYLAVKTGKADVYAGDLAIFNSAVREGLTGLKALDENLGEDGKVAVGISPVSSIPDLKEMIDKFLAEMEIQGVLEDMYQRWVIDGDYSIPQIEKPKNPSLTIKIGTTGLLEPYTFYEGTELTGYEIEMMSRFANWANAEVEVLTYDWGGIIQACAVGKVDIIMSNLFDTDDHDDTIGFSNPYIKVTTSLILPEGEKILQETEQTTPEYGSPEEINAAKARMGVRTGSIQDAYTKEYLPDTSIFYFDGISDMIVALNSGKIDGFMTTTPRVPLILRENDKLSAFELNGPEDKVAFMVARTDFGKELQTNLNEYISSSRDNGLFEEIYNSWFNAKNSYPEVISLSELPNTKKIIRYVAQGNMEPVSFIKENKLTGFEMDLLTRFCKEYGYGLTVTESNISGMLAGITSGKYDLAGGGLAITEERRQSVDFTESYYSYGQWIITRSMVDSSKDAAVIGKSLDSMSSGVTDGSEDSFWTSIWKKLSNSFYKNFAKESRWKLLLSGIGTTLIISIMSAIIGTVFGFGVCLLRMNKKNWISKTTKSFIRFIQGVPLVVLLMIMYYVVFGSVDISAVIVAIVGISINFGVYVSEMMRSGIEAVDNGQIEASLALGYSNVQTFRKITFPQAARHFLPVYKGEFISMVKMTSIVGYIAIQDLTKVSDIIRSRTYEAFFPLIVTAVIYFILAWGLTSILNLVEIKIDPKVRSRKVKGVIEE